MTKQPAVAFYGKVRIPTIGHKKAIDTMKDVAKSTGGRSYIGLSGTSHPLTSEQKKTHAEALFHHPVMTGDAHSKNLFSFLSHVNKHHDEVHLVAGSDRAPEYKKTLSDWNGRKDSKGNVPFKFKKWKVHEVQGERVDSPKHPTKMSSDELERTVSATKVEGLAHKGDYAGFKAYHPGLPEKHVKTVYDQIRAAGPKPITKIKQKLKEELTHKHFGPMLDSFVSFASDKLGIQSMPNIQLKKADEQGEQPSFGGYNPSNDCIVVITKNRHPMDIFRTVAHELVHHKQKEDGRVGKDIAKEGSTGSDIENEANAKAGELMRWFGKANPGHFALQSMTEEFLQEGLNDPATHTAVFLAGGPGSGKDFVMNRTLQGHGLTEINSDNALEHLMKKHSLDPKMPENQKTLRDIVRGRAKNIAREKQRLALTNRQGVIINGTADDPEKIATVKGQLENLGYKTMMVFVNTTNKISAERNNLRGITGGRSVPEKIRNEKWHLSQKAKPKYKKMFGDENFVHVDNSDDYNALPPEHKAAKDNEHIDIFNKVRQFTTTPTDTPQAVAWRRAEMARRGITLNKTIPITQSSRAQQMDEETKKMKGPDPCWKGYQMVGKKKKNGREVPNCVPIKENDRETGVDKDFKKFFEENKPSDREIGSNSLTTIYKKTTPGQHNESAMDDALKAIEREFSPEKMKERQEKRDKARAEHPDFNKWLKERGRKNPYKKELNQEDAMPPAPGNVYGPTSLLGPDGIGPTAPTATMAAGGGVTGGGYSIPLMSVNESIQNWANNPKTQERFKNKYGDLAEQKLIEVAQRLNTLSYNTIVKPKHITEFVNGDITLAGDGVSKGKDSQDTYGIYSGRGGEGGDRMYEEGPGQKKIRQALEKMQKGKPDPEETKKKMVSDMQKLDPKYKPPIKEQSLMGAYMPRKADYLAKFGVKDPQVAAQYDKMRAIKHAHAQQYETEHPEKSMIGKGPEPRAKRHMEESTPAWQRKEGKNPEGGLNKKGIESYRREHPGSKLSLAVTTKPSKLKKGSKRWKRRKSFCARMGGAPGPMKDEKGRPTRKALALRKWNCEE